MEFRCLFLFVFDHLGGDDRLAAEDVAHLVACRDVFVDTLCYDVAGTSQSLFGGVDALFRVHEGQRQLLCVALVLFHQRVGQGLQPLLDGHRSARLAFGLIGQVEVFQLGEGFGFFDGGLQFGGQLALLADALQDGVAAFVNLFQLEQHVADGGDLNLVEVAGDFFAVACNERHGGSRFQKLYGLFHLADTDIDLVGNNMCVIHHEEL